MYKVAAGDTFEKISRTQYGTEEYASLISKANSGASEPLSVGTILVIPDQPDAPRDRVQQAIFDSPNEVSILIENKRFRFWTDVQITRSIDAMDSVEFTAPFDYKNAAFREIFQPFSFKKMEINVGGDPLFTGTVIGVNPVIEMQSKTLSISGYSKPAVLGDCTPPAGMFSEGESGLEFSNQNLRDIAIALAGPFGISTVFFDDAGPAFERVAIKAGAKILGFLQGLAKQRNLIISSSENGELIFQKSYSDLPVAKLEQGASPLLSVTPFFSPQEYYSHVTGIKPVAIGTHGSQQTVKNPHLSGVVRPHTFTAKDVQGGETVDATDSKIGRMYGNAASYSVGVNTWRDSYGQLWEPNTTISILAPDAMIYKAYEFIVRSIVFSRDQSSESAVMNVVMKGAFSGEIPETLPWEE